jgi:hypothetical protein
MAHNTFRWSTTRLVFGPRLLPMTLEPCPFCAHKAPVLIKVMGGWAVSCGRLTCGAVPFHRASREFARRSWNRRRTPPRHTKRRNEFDRWWEQCLADPKFRKKYEERLSMRVKI